VGYHKTGRERERERERKEFFSLLSSRRPGKGPRIIFSAEKMTLLVPINVRLLSLTPGDKSAS